MLDAEALFRLHHQPLLRYLSRLVGDQDQAADAAQLAFIQLMQRPPAPAHVRAWLFKVGANAALEANRTRGRRARLLERAPGRAPAPDSALPADVMIEREQLRIRVQAALQSLPERDRQILLLREEGFSHREIAEAVGTTTGSVGTMIGRALDKLAAALPMLEEQ